MRVLAGGAARRGARHDVDARDRLARAASSASDERARRAREREHGAVVVGVGVHVEQAHRAAAPANASPSAAISAWSRPSETFGAESKVGG